MHKIGRIAAAAIMTVCLALGMTGVKDSKKVKAAEQETVQEEESTAEEEAVQTEESTEEEAGSYNILLIGVDRRDDSWEGNSDVMILVTVNYEKEKVFLTSFLRDLYADIPGIGVRKLNAACANGGPELCVETICSNYDVEIDNYALVDFNSMIAIVDILGGVEIEIDEDERVVANDYIKSMCKANNEPEEDHLIKSAGLINMDGYQAVGYSRNRYTGGENDFGRTERQRKVMTAIFSKLEEGGPDMLVTVLPQIMMQVENDLSYLSLLALIPKLSEAVHYEIEEQHIPYDDMYYIQDEILIPTDMEETIEKLTSTIY